MNLLWSRLPKCISTKLKYMFHPSTAIQENVVSKKYCISAATNWQPRCCVTLSTPAKNIISRATKEKQRHRRILDDSFLLRLLKREIYSYNLDNYYIAANIFTEKREFQSCSAKYLLLLQPTMYWSNDYNKHLRYIACTALTLFNIGFFGAAW